jgi:hypothetical protein
MSEPSSQTSRRSSPRLLTAIALFVLGLGIVFTRFPPADLTGWIAQSLHVTLGVPYFGVALIFAAAASRLTAIERYRRFRSVIWVCAGCSLAIGLSLVAIPV